MIRFRWCAAVALPAVLVLGGCGTGSDDLVRRAAEEFTAAVSSGDSDRACGLLTEKAREDVECSSLDVPGGTVRSVEVWGDAAIVRTSADVLFLRDVTSGWRVAGAGCESRGERPYRCEVGGP
ncbi:hypothetical protein FHX81_1806 [Saccharothrix saharensis]|uniref:Uncharacterized protein n=1 Tax=Saccharothrix saharensis TaxID=571190 RepID=A0A543J9L6_9PSEU|nr:hypothetical protein [Saccharothrix saharensis]TQM79498.1 hypothetical protein FHX81_1806 [Saccharothrix saharensis]